LPLRWLFWTHAYPALALIVSHDDIPLETRGRLTRFVLLTMASGLIATLRVPPPPPWLLRVLPHALQAWWTYCWRGSWLALALISISIASARLYVISRDKAAADEDDRATRIKLTLLSIGS